jgi:hypothetical protein
LPGSRARRGVEVEVVRLQIHPATRADAEAIAAAHLASFAEAGPSQDDDAAAGAGELMARHVIQSRWRRGAGRVLHDAAVATLAARGF